MPARARARAISNAAPLLPLIAAPACLLACARVGRLCVCVWDPAGCDWVAAAPPALLRMNRERQLSLKGHRPPALARARLQPKRRHSPPHAKSTPCQPAFNARAKACLAAPIPARPAIHSRPVEQSSAPPKPHRNRQPQQNNTQCSSCGHPRVNNSLKSTAHPRTQRFCTLQPAAAAHPPLAAPLPGKGRIVGPGSPPPTCHCPLATPSSAPSPV